jgi:hypothetical protein
MFQIMMLLALGIPSDMTYCGIVMTDAMLCFGGIAIRYGRSHRAHFRYISHWQDPQDILRGHHHATVVPRAIGMYHHSHISIVLMSIV